MVGGHEKKKPFCLKKLFQFKREDRNEPEYMIQKCESVEFREKNESFKGCIGRNARIKSRVCKRSHIRIIIYKIDHYLLILIRKTKS